MIDLSSESLIRLVEAPDYLPRKNGKKIHTSTLFRWASSGIGGVVLETGKVGGARCTSLEALQRFTERISRPNGEPASKPRRSAERARRTAKVLREAGLQLPSDGSA